LRHDVHAVHVREGQPDPGLERVPADDLPVATRGKRSATAAPRRQRAAAGWNSAATASGARSLTASAPLFEGGHHLSREAREILLHDLLRRSQGTRDHHVLEPGITPLHVLQVRDELLGGTAEPGTVLHAVLDRGGGR